MTELVVATAGHIDHGKTSLVRALTGVDLDALPEERERGITIALGFTHLDVDGRRLAFVDVPGHERLVRTMIAGAAGVDAVVLCVAADDGVMPQTREHLAVLDLLGVRSGVVALTKADLVDPELLALAREDASDAVRGTFLEGAPVIGFSAETGVGRDGLLAALAALAPRERTTQGPFRLPVDRTFVRPGFGTVVTGTVASGALSDGDGVTLLPSGVDVRVRGMQVHGDEAREVRAGARVALNLAGVDRDAVGRGDVVTRGDVPCPQVLDVAYRHLPDAPPLADGAPVRVLLGTTERVGRVAFAADWDEIAPGASVFAQLRLDAPLPCLPGDRFVLRRASPVETLGGGRVLDPWATRMRRRDRDRVARELARLDAGDREVFLERAGEVGLPPRDWAARGGQGGVTLGDRVLAAPVVARLEGALLEGLRVFHDEHPLALGANRRELRRGRLGHLTERVFDALVDGMSDKGIVRIEGPFVRLSTFEVTPTPAQEALQDRIVATIQAAGVVGVPVKALHEAHPEPEVAALVHLAEARGAVRQIPGIGWVAPSALSALRERLRAWFAGHDALTTGDLKEMAGLTRKTAIPLLEWLDRQQITRRDGDVRRAGGRL